MLLLIASIETSPMEGVAYYKILDPKNPNMTKEYQDYMKSLNHKITGYDQSIIHQGITSDNRIQVPSDISKVYRQLQNYFLVDNLQDLIEALPQGHKYRKEFLKHLQSE